MAKGSSSSQPASTETDSPPPAAASAPPAEAGVGGLRSLRTLLAGLQLGPDQPTDAHLPLAAVPLPDPLAADLPRGHLHLWGGPDGAGKRSFLLALVRHAAARGQGVLYVTYNLPAESLARRLLAMLARVAPDALPDGAAASSQLSPTEAARARAARKALSDLPFALLEARGFGVRSLADRLVRLPWRASVCVVDTLQGVVRPRGQDLSGAMQDLSALASHHHVAVLCSVRAAGVDLQAFGQDRSPDRVCAWALSSPAAPTAEGGHAAPAGENATGPTDTCTRIAEVLHNRHGACARTPLSYDLRTGSIQDHADTAPEA